jgi:hypothetical protein
MESITLKTRPREAERELIITSGKGFRPPGKRNPHSWTIVDEPDLADWVAKSLQP